MNKLGMKMNPRVQNIQSSLRDDNVSMKDES